MSNTSSTYRQHATHARHKNMIRRRTSESAGAHKSEHRYERRSEAERNRDVVGYLDGPNMLASGPVTVLILLSWLADVLSDSLSLPYWKRRAARYVASESPLGPPRSTRTVETCLELESHS